MRIAQLTSPIASPVLTIALFGTMLTSAFTSQAQSATPMRAADCCGGTPAAVLAPSGTTNTATLANTANLSSFYHLLDQAGLRARLQRYPATYTIFAPTNDAMAAIAAPVRERMHQIGAPVIKSVARVHIVPGTFTADQLTEGRELETLEGRKLRVKRQADGTILLDGIYRLRDTGQPTNNGIIYTLDTVIVP